jgi:hypothetical protein
MSHNKEYLLSGNISIEKCIPSVTGVFIPLWQRGIKGDLKIIPEKISPCPSFPKRGIRVHLYYLNP